MGNLRHFELRIAQVSFPTQQLKPSVTAVAKSQSLYIVEMSMFLFHVVDE